MKYSYYWQYKTLLLLSGIVLTPFLEMIGYEMILLFSLFLTLLPAVTQLLVAEMGA